jgi:hypothetical protein
MQLAWQLAGTSEQQILPCSSHGLTAVLGISVVRRALGWHLLSCKGKAEMDAQQWEQDATEKQQKVAELEQEVQKVQQELEQRISSFQVWWSRIFGALPCACRVHCRQQMCTLRTPSPA